MIKIKVNEEVKEIKIISKINYGNRPYIENDPSDWYIECILDGKYTYLKERYDKIKIEFL